MRYKKSFFAITGEARGDEASRHCFITPLLAAALSSNEASRMVTSSYRHARMHACSFGLSRRIARHAQ
jgi:hypothetical protein